MSTRQTIKTYKNYKTGETKQEYVIKPNQRSFNTITVQLFDDSGELEQEAYSENVISDSLDYYLYADAMDMLFGYAPPSQSFFDIIVLTDYAGEEDSTDFNAYGKILGYCQKNNGNSTQGSLTKGICNSTESYGQFENGKYHLHLVYDWLTSTGNGTFQSIYWIPYADDYSSLDQGTAYLGLRLERVQYWPYWTNTVPVENGNYNIVCDLLGNWYKVVNSKYYKVTNTDEFLYANKAAVLSAAESFVKPFETSSSFWDVTLTNDAVYSTYSTAHTCKFNIKQYDRIGTLMDQYDVDVLDSSPSLKQLVASGHVYNLQKYTYGIRTTGELIMYVQVDMSSHKEIPGVAPGNVVTPNQYATRYYTMVWDLNNKTWKRTLDINNYISSSAYYFLTGYGNCTQIMELSKDKTVAIVFSSGVVIYIRNIWEDSMTYLYGKKGFFTPTGSDYNLMAIDRTRGVVWTGVSGNYWYHLMSTWSAHTKLSSPVTKTTTNTMKIQYDFYFDIPRPRQVGKENIIKPFSS